MAKKTTTNPAKSKGPMTGFEFGAQVLEISVDALIEVYEKTVDVMIEGIKAGKTNAPVGLISLLAYYDLLHGGAYAAPINFRPFYLKNPAASKYYAGDLQNLVNATWVAWLAQNTAGESATQMANEILMDANVPHVFPKLLSDETFAQIKISYAQIGTTALFNSASTGVSTLVEGITKGAERLRGGGGGGMAQEDVEELVETQTRAALAEIGKVSS